MTAPARVPVDDLLAEARGSLRRVAPTEAYRELSEGASLVDIRTESQIAGDGAIPGARLVARNVLEWRLDPCSAHRLEDLARPGTRVIVVCDGGFQSSLAAATLRRLGLDATDVEGGFQAWCEAGLPVVPLT